MSLSQFLNEFEFLSNVRPLRKSRQGLKNTWHCVTLNRKKDDEEDFHGSNDSCSDSVAQLMCRTGFVAFVQDLLSHPGTYYKEVVVCRADTKYRIIMAHSSH